MFKSHIKICVLFLTLTLVMVFADVNEIQSQIDDTNEAFKNTQDELRRIDTEKNILEVKQSELLSKLDAVQNEIRVIDAEILSLSKRIEETKDAIDIKQIELDDAKREVVYQNDRMKKRLRTMYKTGDVTYLEILISSKNMSEMMTQLDKIQILLDYDKDMLTNLVDARNFIDEAKSQLEEQKSALSELKNDETIKLADKEIKRDELYVVQKEYETNYQGLIELEAQVTADADRLTAVLRDLEIKKDYIQGDMMWPVPSGYRNITSPFGMRTHPVLGQRMMHTGIDIAAPGGAEIYAVKSGTVLRSAYLGSYGQAVLIDHGGGIHTLYAHASKLLVSVGDEVTKGQTIALVGTTGRSTGNHLHFEVRENGVYVDPTTYLFK